MKKSKGTVEDITERKRAEEALAESEERYRRSFDDAAIGMALVSPNAKFLRVNPALCKITGYPEEELLSKTFQDITHPEDLQIGADYLRKLVAGEIDIANFEKRYVHKDGRTVWISITTTLLRDAEGNPLHCVAQTQDVTERKRVEEELKKAHSMLERRVKERTAELRESEEKFRSLAEQSPNMIFINKKGTIVYANEKCEELMGYKRGELYSPDFDFLVLIVPESRDQVKANFSRHAKGGEVPPYEYSLLTKEGKRIEAIITTKLITYGGESAILGVITDITERKQAEEALQKSEADLAEAQKIANLGSCDWNIQTNELHWSDEIYRIFGLNPQEFVPTYETFFDSVHPDDRGSIKKAVDEALHGKKPYSIDHRIVLPDGSERVVHEEAEVFFDEAGKPIRMLGTVQDITGRKQAEETLNIERQQLLSIFDSIDEVIYVSDPETYEILYVNQALREAFGDVAGQKCYRALQGMESPCPFCTNELIFGKNTGQPHIWEFQNRVNQRWYRCIDKAIRWPDGRMVRYEMAIDVTERKLAEEDVLKKFLRYRVKKGEVYLIKEPNPDLSVEVFKDVLSCGFSGTVFSRAKGEEIEKIFGRVKTFWFAESPKAKDATEPRFSEIESRIKALGTGNNAVLLDRMDYLISKNGFDATLKFVQRLFERAYHQGLIVLLALDPKTLRPLELRRLEKETKRVEPRVKSRLPEDIHEILKFVYTENRIGEYPSYTDIHETFKITRTTARNRIKRLKAMKFLVDRKRGRTKVLELTDEGREQF